jgi:hypothetical protein
METADASDKYMVGKQCPGPRYVSGIAASRMVMNQNIVTATL